MNDIDTILGQRPGKIIAVHLSYASRAAQRGRTPAFPSYFLKTSSSLTGSGEVARPAGTELLGFEGEIALIIGKAVKDVSPQEGWSHVGWVTAANDLGLHDLRYADKGSNVRSKSGDGYTPIGPHLMEASRLDEAAIGVRTRLDGEVVQDDTSAGMLFSFGEMIADLSRFMTLEEGDIILTGTPAGASVATPGQRIEVEVFSVTDPTITSGTLITEIVEGPALAAHGNPPKVDAAQRADAWGTEDTSEEFVLTDDVRERLTRVAVATLSSQLRARGYSDVSIDGVHPLIPGSTIVGRARTLRYLPFRKDEFAKRGGGYNAQKRAIDSVNEGEVLVMDARGVTDAGTLGDILALRAQVRGAAGIITDGCVRDYAIVAEAGLPVFAASHHPAVLGRRHIPWETDVDIACGGALVRVGDVVVADDDGPIVIPPALVLEVLEAAEKQESEEDFITDMVAAGESVDGLYPMNAAWRARYDAHRAQTPETQTHPAQNLEG